MKKAQLSILFVFIFVHLVVSQDKTAFLVDNMISYTINSRKQELKFYWKDKKGNILQKFDNLIVHLNRENKRLVFAMNGGMFTADYSPLGLYIENFKTIKQLNTAKGSGNFYMKPNGVFGLKSDNQAFVCKSENFKNQKKVKFATQSGPLLLIDGNINPKFNKSSNSYYIRNGVGILEDGKILFAISTETVNFYEFASYFKEKGCKQALYLDGFVSRIYLPEKGIQQMDGSFGVIIGVIGPV